MTKVKAYNYLCNFFILLLFICIMKVSVSASDETVISEEVKITDFAIRNMSKETTSTYHIDKPSAISGELTLSGKYGVPLEASPASIIGPDDRYHPENSSVFPNRFIVYMDITWPNGSVTGATGWMCAPSTVMTVAHNTYNSSLGGWAKKIRIWPGRNGNNTPYGSATATEIHMPSAYKYYEIEKYDVAMIYLNTPIGNRTGYFGVKYKPSSYVGTTVFVAGYPNSKNKEIWKMSGTINNATQSQIYYTIDTEDGQSGSPVYFGSGSERFCVGIHNGGNTTRNTGTRITHCIFNWIKLKRK